ncbi:hypothetical protein HYALB_00001377 [Hymenoscyphus albidus]|uniref:2EXR domain-containing protein n=1 Tax=Hymenoscyphus albidus TaxID=595503 RepID=A0A9N9LF54_9HELO|nr:hypothetical protein HYALB_00001377 [Hymenoscyphus albidus]
MEPNPASDLGDGLPDLPKEISVPQTLQAFTIFSNLATELRLKIWGLSILSNPRIIEILQRGTDTSNYSFYTPTCNPPPFSTCQESRAEALKHYHLSFPTVSQPGIIYFNPIIDIIYYPSWFWRHENPEPLPETTSSILHLAIEPLEWFSGATEDGMLNGFPIKDYRNLKSHYHVLRDCPRGVSCWCAVEQIAPEKGVITFGNIEIVQQGAEDLRGIKCEVVRAFGEIKEQDPEWSVPVFLEGEMMRNGKAAEYIGVYSDEDDDDGVREDGNSDVNEYSNDDASDNDGEDEKKNNDGN